MIQKVIEKFRNMTKLSDGENDCQALKSQEVMQLENDFSAHK